MNDPPTVRLRYGLTHLHEPVDGRSDGKRTANVQNLLEVLPFEIFEDQIGATALHEAHVEHPHGVLALYACCRATFSQESLDGLLVALQLRQEHFQSYALIQAGVPSGHHDRKAAPSAFGFNSVFARDELAMGGNRPSRLSLLGRGHATGQNAKAGP